MAMKWKCLLNASGVLGGYEQVDEATLAPGDLAFDTKPDLDVPGKYIWNGESFFPVRKQHPFIPDGPDPWDAVVYAMARAQLNYKALQDMLAILKQLPALQGVPEFQALEIKDIPKPCAQFLKYYRDTIMRQPADTPGGG
jgi:hypothetical protein